MAVVGQSGWALLWSGVLMCFSERREDVYDKLHDLEIWLEKEKGHTPPPTRAATVAKWRKAGARLVRAKVVMEE